MRAAVCILLALGTFSLPAQGESPSTLPTTAPANQPIAADHPMAAFDAMIVAFEKEDPAALNAAVDFEGYPLTAEQFIGFMKSIHVLNAAARERFGDSTPDIMPSERALHDLRAATRLQMEGDEAALVQGPSDGPVKVLPFKKVDGKWKVSFLPIAPRSNDPTEEFRQFSRIAEETSAEIKEGKFASSDEARARVNQRMAEMHQPPQAKPDISTGN